MNDPDYEDEDDQEPDDSGDGCLSIIVGTALLGVILILAALCP